MKIIPRTTYLDELTGIINIPDIKIITGIRRAGKSKLMDALVQVIEKSDPTGNIIHINYNLTEFEDLLEYHSLESYIETNYKAEVNNYVLIDEIQMCDHFEKAVNSLHAKEKYDIYVTGSNAFLQSSDLATLFVGRTYEVHILPFSFKEYMSYFPSENINASLTKYMTEGGMAGSFPYKDLNQKYRYINNEVLNALVVRDIIAKYKIRNEPLLHILIDFLMDNIGSELSVRSITDWLSGNKTKADHKTIGKYIEYLCKAFAFYRVRRYDIKGKKYLGSADKYYLSDHSFKYARLGTKNMDYGHVLENIIAMELIRRGYEIYVGVAGGKEIDFVAMKQGNRTYIQVSYDITEQKTFDREVAPLLKINDAYPKMIIARTYQPEYQYEGIRIIDAAEWLSCDSQGYV
ncbi:MAG: ATP-binding protein [Clostridiales bacterium]|nr:ATP-binding protein [Clostridiales bacterium]